jgi:hypothetical protein
MSLRLLVKVQDVREATADEIEARSVGGQAAGVFSGIKASDHGPLH